MDVEFLYYKLSKNFHSKRYFPNKSPPKNHVVPLKYFVFIAVWYG